MVTQQEDVLIHAQIRQILKWKKQYPDWRLPATKFGDDVPQFCTPPKRALQYLQTLAVSELDEWNGFWEFSRFDTNEYDLKSTLRNWLRYQPIFRPF